MAALFTMIALWFGMQPAAIQAGEVKEAVTRFIETSLQASAESARVEFHRLPAAFSAPSARYRLEVEPLTRGSLRGAVSLAVNVVVGGTVEQRIMLSAGVRTYGTVVVAARPMERHAVIAADDISLRQVETTTLVPGYCRRAEEVVGRRTRRIFTPGGIIYAAMCGEVPLVRQGDPVTIVVRAGAVTLSAPATAKQDGGQGDLIIVQRRGSHERIRSRVLDARTVEACIQ